MKKDDSLALLSHFLKRVGCVEKMLTLSDDPIKLTGTEARFLVYRQAALCPSYHTF